jgi:hypothetical protein
MPESATIATPRVTGKMEQHSSASTKKLVMVSAKPTMRPECEGDIGFKDLFRTGQCPKCQTRIRVSRTFGWTFLLVVLTVWSFFLILFPGNYSPLDYVLKYVFFRWVLEPLMGACFSALALWISFLLFPPKVARVPGKTDHFGLI